MILNRTIILVEDSDSDRMLFAKYLKQMGFGCVSFDSADKLLAHLEEFEPGIILMDIEMPGINGLDAVRILRKRQEINGGKHIIIALTAHNDENLPDIVSRAGFDDYLQKPITKADLKSRLSRYLKSESETSIVIPVMNSENGNPGDKLYSLDMFDADDPDFVHSIIEMFVTNTPGSIASIKVAFENDEMEFVRQQAHKLKPHFMFFGAANLQQAFQRIEDLAKSNPDRENLIELINSVEKTSLLMIAQMKADLLS